MTKREKLLLIVAIIILIFSFALKSIILPTINRYYAITEEYQESLYEIEKNKLKISSSDKYISELEEINSENELLKQLFYMGDSSDIRLEVLNYLDGQIIDQGLDIESKEFSIEQVSQNKEFGTNDSMRYDSEHYGSTQYGSTNDLDKLKARQMIIMKPIKMTYRAQLRGSYQQVLSFLESLASYHKFYSVSQLDMKDDSNESQLAVFVVIESYCIEGDKNDKEKV